MKHILASMFAIGTMFASYSAYKSDQLAPLVAEIQKLRLPSPAAQTTSGFMDPQTGYSAGYANLQSQTAPGSAGLQTGSDPGYAGLLLPHLQFAFSPLESNSGKLAEEPLLRLREILAHDRETAEAREAIRMLDELRTVLREREIYRARFEESARRFESEEIRMRIAREWLTRAGDLAPSFRRAYADLFAHEEESRLHGAQAARVRESYAQMARLDSSTRPRFEEHADYGSVAHRETGHADQYRNPIEQNRNSLEEHRKPLEEYHSPLEQSSGHRVVGNANSHGPYLEGSHQTSTTRAPSEEHGGSLTTTQPGSHSYTNPFANPLSQPSVVHPPPVAHTNNPPPVVHTN